MGLALALRGETGHLFDLGGFGTDEGAHLLNARPGLLDRQTGADQVGRRRRRRPPDAGPAVHVDRAAPLDFVSDEFTGLAELIQRRRRVVDCGQVQVAGWGDAGVVVVELDAQVDYTRDPPAGQPAPASPPVLPPDVELRRDLAHAPDGRAGEDTHEMIGRPPRRHFDPLIGESPVQDADWLN